LSVKSVLKTVKLNESTISMLLGAIVIVVVGLLVINYFRGLESGNTSPTAVNTENTTTLPTTHTVVQGETLWSISEKYYGSGFNWVDIRDANSLRNANDISEDQQLTIPVAEKKTEELADASSPAPTATVAVAATASPSPSPSAAPEKTIAPTSGTKVETDAISDSSYTVVRGDSLWKIAVRAYGDGYKWVEIAKANNLANPNLIHAGNVLTLPR
jgi:nucleoid-associated protein YgaU